MTTVRELLGEGTTICATIHSPTAYAFSLFDSLMMLTRGRVVYFGKRAGSAIEYALASWPHKGDAEALANEAEWLVDLITKADRDGTAAAFADTYDASPLAASNLKALEAKLADLTPLPHHLEQELSVQRTTVTPFWWGLKTIVKYRTPRNYRDPEFLGPRIGDKFIMTFLMWSLYWQLGSEFAVDNYINQSGAKRREAAGSGGGSAAPRTTLHFRKQCPTPTRGDKPLAVTEACDAPHSHSLS